MTDKVESSNPKGTKRDFRTMILDRKKAVANRIVTDKLGACVWRNLNDFSRCLRLLCCRSRRVQQSLFCLENKDPSLH